MNLILFAPEETVRPLPRRDPRALHLLEVLRRRPGDSFDAGLVNGPRGKGLLRAVEAGGLEIAFSWGAEPPAPDPLTLIVGLPRPQTGRKLLQEAAALGVEALHFTATEKGEASYGQSALWQEGEWRRHLIAGAEQAFDTRLPAVTHGRPLAEILAGLAAGGVRAALDNYEAAEGLGSLALPGGPPAVALAIGPERGWSAAERALLRAGGFTLVHLGPRVLRAETAMVAAVAILKSRLGWI